MPAPQPEVQIEERVVQEAGFDVIIHTAGGASILCN
jgi:hypothetical protein